MAIEEINLKDLPQLPSEVVDSDKMHVNRDGIDYQVPASEFLKSSDVINDLEDANPLKPASSELTNSLHLSKNWLIQKSALIFAFDAFWNITRDLYNLTVIIPAGRLIDVNSGSLIPFNAQAAYNIPVGGGIYVDIGGGSITFYNTDNISEIIEGETLNRFVIAKNSNGVLRSAIATINDSLYEGKINTRDLSWLFAASTADSDPGAGYFRMNNATPANVTFLYLSKTSHQNIDVASILLDLVEGGSIQIIQGNNILKYIIAEVGIVVDATNYVKIPVTILNSGTLFDTGSECSTSIFYEESQQADENVKVGPGGTPDYLNENYFVRDETEHIRIKLAEGKILEGNSNGIAIASDSLQRKAEAHPSWDASTVPTADDIVIDEGAGTLTFGSVNGAPLSANNKAVYYLDEDGKAVRYEISAPVVFDFSAKTEGVWWFYFDSTGPHAVQTVTPPGFGDMAPLYRFYWSAVDLLVNTRSIEYHPNTLAAVEHEWKHINFGTIWLSGFDLVCTPLPSGTPNSSGLNTCVSLTSGNCMDDNLPYSVINTGTGAKFTQDLGNVTAANITTANGALMKASYNDANARLRILAASRFPFLFNAGTNIPEYVTANGTRTPVTNNYFFVYFIYVLQDDKSGEAVRIRSALQEFSTLALAQAYNWEDMLSASLTLKDKEIRPLHKLIYEYKSTFNVAIKYAALRETLDIRKERVKSISSSTTSILDSNVVLSTVQLSQTNQAGLNAELVNRSRKNKYDATTAPGVNDDNTIGYLPGSLWIDVTNDKIYICVDATTGAAAWTITQNFEVVGFSMSDLTTALTTGKKEGLHIPFDSDLISLFIGVDEAPTGATLIVDLKKNGTTIFNTKVSIDASETTSLTAATPYVLTAATSFTKGDYLTSHIDQIGATNAGKGAKCYLLLKHK